MPAISIGSPIYRNAVANPLAQQYPAIAVPIQHREKHQVSSRANSYVYAVRYNWLQPYIERVRAYAVNSDGTFGTATEWTRDQVIAAIELGYSFVTVYQQNGTWYIGEDVRVVTVSGVKYLRTDANNIAGDNLGNLPRF
jgi:hypothetical protein